MHFPLNERACVCQRVSACSVAGAPVYVIQSENIAIQVKHITYMTVDWHFILFETRRQSDSELDKNFPHLYTKLDTKKSHTKKTPVFFLAFSVAAVCPPSCQIQLVGFV